MPNKVAKWAVVSGDPPVAVTGPIMRLFCLKAPLFVRAGGQAAHLDGMDAGTIVLRARWLPAREFGWTGGVNDNARWGNARSRRATTWVNHTP